MLYFACLIYFLFVIVLGVFASKRIKTVDDYLIANRKLPTWILLPTIVATWYGAGSCMGVAGEVYSDGALSVLADPFGCSLALLIAGLFYAGPLRRLKLRTISDIIGKTYGKKSGIFASTACLPFYIGTLAAQMVAIGYLCHIVTDLPITLGICIGSLIVLTYTMWGGMWAVSITDILQLLFLTTGLAIIFFKMPAAENVAVELKTLLPSKANFGLSYIGQILMTGLGAIMGQDLIQRFLSAKNVSAAKKSSIYASVIYLILGLIPLLIGLAGRQVLPNLELPELLLPSLAQKLLSPIGFTLFAVGILSAVMSTADSYLLAGTAIFTQNILFPMLPIREENKLKIMRVSNIFLTICAFCLALYAQRIFDLMVHSGALLFVAVFVPVTLALYLKRPSQRGGVASMVAGTVSWVAYLGIWALWGTANATDALYAAAICGVVCSLGGYFIWSRKSDLQHRQALAGYSQSR